MECPWKKHFGLEGEVFWNAVGCKLILWLHLLLRKRIYCLLAWQQCLKSFVIFCGCGNFYKLTSSSQCLSLVEKEGRRTQEWEQEGVVLRGWRAGSEERCRPRNTNMCLSDRYGDLMHPKVWIFLDHRPTFLTAVEKKCSCVNKWVQFWHFGRNVYY